MIKRRLLIFIFFLILISLSMPEITLAQNESDSVTKKIDASDPTKIYTYVGAGPKFTEYTNNESMLELRASGNLGISKEDMVFINFGYGFHFGDKVEGSNNGFTNARARWFHIFKMDYSVASGYRGWATQIDFQMAGQLKGTDGQNVLSFGALPAFGLGKKWSLFVPLNVVNSWDKKFAAYNGMGANISPLFVFNPGNWWEGAYLQFWGGYTYFFTGELAGRGGANLDITIGGKILPKLTWTILAQKNFDLDLMSYRRDENSGTRNDWNIFLNFITYF
ncbi:hypothetical protein [Lentimicrobium sp. S6]|uniref:hypothetical protein n=1 Tax=Lentimicrobium sp. S6 TaxID=2735872 RepID=UPI00155530C2|nr:hypothetical protein [Lentimicrobium sp. S6]NPD48131.1 hypothetical protein [Lentimicrobium sp. S6]